MLVTYASFWDTIRQSFVDFWHKIVDLGPKWLVAIIIVLVAWLISILIRRMVQRAMSRISTHGHVDILISRGAGAVVLIAGVLVALGILGLSLTGVLAAIGLASVGIGFALKDILSNLFAGIILLIQHPFTIGDQVMIGNEEGVVENVRVRDTQILTYEGERVYVPNQNVFSNPIINYTSTPSLRIDVRVSIRYEADMEAAKRIAKQIMEDAPGILELPEPMILVEAESEAVVLVMRFWMGADRNRRLNLQSEVLESTIKAFQEQGIVIPYPIRTIEFSRPLEGKGEEEPT